MSVVGHSATTTAIAGTPAQLTRSWLDRRALRSLVLTSATWLAAVIAAVPLVSVL